MHGEVGLVEMTDGDMEWVLLGMMDMGKWKIIIYDNRIRNIRNSIFILNHFYFSGWGSDNDTTIINN
jgi:hypothetical protein